MAKKIVVNVIPEEIRMALTDDGVLLEVAVERTESNHMVGNIYKGRVENVLPGMQAAFINIGIGKNAFLYAGDIFPHKSFQRLVEEDNLTVGAEIMVEIVKDAMGTKGPRATTHFSIPGRYVVVMPSVDYVGISRRIESVEERSRLRKLAEKIRPKGMGVIVRTVAEGHSEEELARDFQYLANLWQALTAKAKKVKAPSLIYRDADLVIRIIRDHVKDDIEEVIIDDADAYNRMVELAKFLSPDLVQRIHLYKGKTEIFTHFGIEEEWNRLADRRVDLKCGGYLIIDKTEALTVIDVNTGRFTGHSNLADTVFKANMEAVAEIARQLRLRDIGGIIVADFIDMQKESHKKAVLLELESRLKADNTKTNVLGLTELGLVEMTRKKARQTYEGTLYEPCPCCGGRGIMQSADTLVISILRQLRRISSKRPGAQLVVQMHPRIAETFAAKTALPELEAELGIELTVETVDGMQPEVFSILEGKKALHRSAEPKRQRRLPRKSVKDESGETESELATITAEDMTPLMVEKFAMTNVADPPSSLEARLNAMAGLLWEPLMEEDEPEDGLPPIVERPPGDSEAVEPVKKNKRRRRSNKMTIAEAMGLTVDNAEQEEVLRPESEAIGDEPAVPESAEVAAPAKKSRRRRKTKKKVDESEATTLAEVAPVPQGAAVAPGDAEITSEADDPEESLVKKSKRRRRKKKKPADDSAAQSEPVEQQPSQPEPPAIEGTGEPVEDAVKKTKRRRRKAKKKVNGQPADALTEDFPSQQDDTIAMDRLETADEAVETGATVAKKSKRRRRKKKKPADDSAAQSEPAETKPLPPEPPVIDEAGEPVEGAVKKTKRRRRRSSGSKKIAATVDVESDETPD